MAEIVLTPPVEDPSDPCAKSKGMMDNYVRAEYELLQGQTVQWGDRRLTRANLSEVRAGRLEWESKYHQCLACKNSAGRPRIGGLRTSLVDLRQDYEGEDR